MRRVQTSQESLSPRDSDLAVQKCSQVDAPGRSDIRNGASRVVGQGERWTVGAG